MESLAPRLGDRVGVTLARRRLRVFHARSALSFIFARDESLPLQAMDEGIDGRPTDLAIGAKHTRENVTEQITVVDAIRQLTQDKQLERAASTIFVPAASVPPGIRLSGHPHPALPYSQV
jgi:hypothetical protein